MNLIYIVLVLCVVYQQSQATSPLSSEKSSKESLETSPRILGFIREKFKFKSDLYKLAADKIGLLDSSEELTDITSALPCTTCQGSNVGVLPQQTGGVGFDAIVIPQATGTNIGGLPQQTSGLGFDAIVIPQLTGTSNGGLLSQQTGISNSGLLSQQTGISNGGGLLSQQTGISNGGGLLSQQTGISKGGGLLSQQTGTYGGDGLSLNGGSVNIPLRVTMRPTSTDYNDAQSSWEFILPQKRYQQVIMVPKNCVNCRYKSVKVLPNADYLAKDQYFRNYYNDCNFVVLVPSNRDIRGLEFDYITIDNKLNYNYDELLRNYAIDSSVGLLRDL